MGQATIYYKKIIKKSNIAPSFSKRYVLLFISYSHCWFSHQNAGEKKLGCFGILKYQKYYFFLWAVNFLTKKNNGIHWFSHDEQIIIFVWVPNKSIALLYYQVNLLKHITHHFAFLILFQTILSEQIRPPLTYLDFKMLINRIAQCFIIFAISLNILYKVKTF